MPRKGRQFSKIITMGEPTYKPEKPEPVSPEVAARMDLSPSAKRWPRERLFEFYRAHFGNVDAVAQRTGVPLRDVFEIERVCQWKKRFEEENQSENPCQSQSLIPEKDPEAARIEAWEAGIEVVRAAKRVVQSNGCVAMDPFQLNLAAQALKAGAAVASSAALDGDVDRRNKSEEKTASLALEVVRELSGIPIQLVRGKVIDVDAQKLLGEE